MEYCPRCYRISGRRLSCTFNFEQVVGVAKMASKDVEMSGKNNVNNSMNDKREYEVEECVPISLPLTL